MVTTQVTAPYVSWRTFWTFIEEQRASDVASLIVDASAFGPNRSGAIRSQINVALRYLGLVNPDRIATQTFTELVGSDDPKHELRNILMLSYGFLFDPDLRRQTVENVELALSDYASNDDMLARARAFFIAAANYAGFELSENLRRSLKRAGSTKITRSFRPVPSAKPQGETFSLSLQSGGTVTLSISVSLFDLDNHERDFVFSLIDQIKGYKPAPG